MASPRVLQWSQGWNESHVLNETWIVPEASNTSEDVGEDANESVVLDVIDGNLSDWSLCRRW